MERDGRISLSYVLCCWESRAWQMEEDGTDFQFSLLLMFYDFKFSRVVHFSVIFVDSYFLSVDCKKEFCKTYLHTHISEVSPAQKNKRVPVQISQKLLFLPNEAQHPHSVKTSSEDCGLDPGLAGSAFQVQTGKREQRTQVVLPLLSWLSN